MKLPFSKNVISLIVALVLGVFTLILVNAYLAKERKTIEAAKNRELGKEVSVVVAVDNIPRGTKLTQNMVQVARVREALLQQRTTGSISRVVGQVAIADILAGEQVSETKLMSAAGALEMGRERQSEQASSGGSLAMKIPAGKRSFTIDIDEVSAAGGMIRPNDYVDIMGIFPFTQQQGESRVTQNVSVALLQNIMVLAVGRQLTSVEATADKGRAGAANTITLALTPQQVELLSFAHDFGKLRLILRPPLETQIQAIPPVTADVLWQQIIQQAGMQMPEQKEAKVEAPEKEPSQTVEIYRGKEKEVKPLD